MRVREQTGLRACLTERVDVRLPRTRSAKARGLPEQRLSALACWTVGLVFALLDVLTTWYAVKPLHLREVNRVGQWVIAEFGLEAALAMRVVIGCSALGLLALATTVRFPRHHVLVNRAAEAVLIGALVIWGAVVVSNAVQIAWYKLS